MNYYNENDPKACAWLAELIKQKLIPEGKIDARSIADVQPEDLEGFIQCHFFTGIAGWPLALQLAGWPSDRPVWTGSCPCQPFSVSGAGKGESDERHLWPEMFRLIAKRKPPIVFGEQVASPLALRWLDGIYADLEGAGYAVGTADLCAASVNAPHIRQRIYWMARANGGRFSQCESKGQSALDVGGSITTGRMANTASDGCERTGQTRKIEEGRQSESESCGKLQDGFERSSGSGWQRVVFSSDLDQDGNCPNCGTDFSECGCPGPTQDGYEYQERGGIMFARWLGKSEQSGLEGQYRHGYDRDEPRRLDQESHRPATTTGRIGHWDRYEVIPMRDGKSRRIEPGTFPLAYGVSGRVGMLRGYGNAIVPEVAAKFIKAYLSIKI